MKACFKCGDKKPLSEFYKHSQMKDGHVNKCKECNKNDVREHRKRNIEKIREYDRRRGNRQTLDDLQRYRAKYPNKYKAHRAVNNAIAAKKLFKQPCEICKKKDGVHAHHDNYLMPLNVRWLCAAHHSQWHAENGEAENP